MDQFPSGSAPNATAITCYEYFKNDIDTRCINFKSLSIKANNLMFVYGEEIYRLAINPSISS